MYVRVQQILRNYLVDRRTWNYLNRLPHHSITTLSPEANTSLSTILIYQSDTSLSVTINASSTCASSPSPSLPPSPCHLAHTLGLKLLTEDGSRTITGIPSGVVSGLSLRGKIRPSETSWNLSDDYVVRVHEACTRRNTQDILNSGGCEYWTDGAGSTFRGRKYLYLKNSR